MGEYTAIGPYQLIGLLGQGGMGIVYRARHVGSDHPVALKTVKLPAPRWLDSIRREIQALTRIRHPGVVRILEHGVHDGRPWYAMDLLEGEHLRSFGQKIWNPHHGRLDRLASSEFVTDTALLSPDAPMLHGEPGDATVPSYEWHPPSKSPQVAAGQLPAVLTIFKKLCHTLAFLHGEGLINCDLKPENVLLVEGSPVIIDFGLIAHHPGNSSREELEAQGSIAGTLPYISPERIRGELVDARSDLYSLGCMLYELLVGSPPFVGAPSSVLRQHLSTIPTMPSERVSGVPPRLERLVSRLLEKSVDHRFGYADEVAADLAELTPDSERRSSYPPARAYLYRPRLVGRAQIVEQLTTLRNRAALGAGAIALVGGESGVGKTRLAMELTRIAPESRMRVVTSQVATLSAEGAPAVRPFPLHALKPLLQAIADRCQEGGSLVTEQLLEDRHALLASYEPALKDVLGHAAAAPPPPLDVEASRQRLFHHLATTIAAFALEEPLFWIIDDLGWADDLSLGFLRYLARSSIEHLPLFVLANYRLDESADAVTDIASVPGVVHLALSRLDRDAVHSITRDMLALQDPPEHFVEFIAEQAEGNPFFVAEYLRTAVSERILVRDLRRTWRVNTGQHSPLEEYQSLGLPRSLRELIERRLRHISPGAQYVALSAAVLGRDVEVETLRAVASISDETSITMLEELLRRQILEQSEPGKLRFVHDKLREVVYSTASPPDLERLHGAAAAVLEANLAVEAQASALWAVIGHHFAAANRPAPAVRYLHWAAENARTTFANGDAIRLYREAIHQLLRCPRDEASERDLLLELFETQGDVLMLSGRREEAQTAYDSALERSSSDVPLRRARLYRKLAKTIETQYPPAETLRLYQSARQTLGDCEPLGDNQGWRDEWIRIRSDQVYAHYWPGRVLEMETLVSELTTRLNGDLTPSQRMRVRHSQLLLAFRRESPVLSHQSVLYADEALNDCRLSGDPVALPMAHFLLAFSLLLNGNFALGESEFRSAVSIADRATDITSQARCLTYLCVCLRRQGSTNEASSWVTRARRVSETAGMPEYVGAALANEGWLAARRGDFDQAEILAGKALSQWELMAYTYSFQWTALLPLIWARVQAHDVRGACRWATSLLGELQRRLQRLPDDLIAPLSSGVDALACNDEESSRMYLEDAIDVSRRFSFL